MSSPNDSTDYIAGFTTNIQTVLNTYKDFIGCNIIETNDDAYIPRYPAITIELENFTEDWKEMPRRKTITANFNITYYYANINDKNVRQGVRLGLSKICNVLRENWDLNKYCPDLGAIVKSSTPYVLAKGTDIVAGGVIVLEASKVISVTFA